jgi:mycothiol system anti-sigma-R factor
MTDAPPPSPQGSIAKDNPCGFVLSSVYAYIDGHLEVSEQVVIKGHLADCPPCDRLYRFEISVRSTVAKCCCETAPTSLRDKILGALRAES